MVRVADCVPRGARRRRGRRHRRRALRTARHCCSTSPPARSRRCARRVPPTSSAWVGPHVCGSCYEVPEQMRGRGQCAVVPEACAETSWGTPALDIGAGVRAQLERAGRRGRRRRRLHPRGAPGCTPTAATAPPPDASPGWCGSRDARRRPRGQPRRRTPPHRRGLRRARGRSPDEVSLVVVTKFFPASDVRAARRPRRHRRGGEPSPGGRRQGRRVRRPRPALALHRRASRATRRPRSRPTPTSSSRSTAPSWSVPSTGARGDAHGRRAAAGQPRPAGLRPPGRRRPRRPSADLARRRGGGRTTSGCAA